MLQNIIFLVFILFEKGRTIRERINPSITITLNNSGVTNQPTKHINPSSLVEYDRGNINLIFAVPHNGALKPTQIKDRKDGCKYRGKCYYRGIYLFFSTCRKSKDCKIQSIADAYTQQIARWTQEEFTKLPGMSGLKPHLVISNLYRAKMDPNREKEHAVQGNYDAGRAYDKYHDEIEYAKNTFGGKLGLLIDFHGQKHERGITEIGYLIKKDELITGKFDRHQPSIRSLIERKNKKIEDFLFGDSSLGKLFNTNGYDAVPSPKDKAPKKEDQYFRGGYSILQHGSNDSGNVDGIQLEFPAKIRNNRETRRKLSRDLAKMLHEFYFKNYEENRYVKEIEEDM